MKIEIGSIITNGSSALRITERVAKDRKWGTAGWRGVCIPLERFGGMTGMSDFIPDYLVRSWKDVPFDWQPCIGGRVEQRYVWADDSRWLQRQVRRIEVPQ